MTDDRKRFKRHGRNIRQTLVAEQVERLWGAASACYLPERGARLLEEALEAAQASGTPEDVALRLVRHVYGRPAGNLAQELGGVGVGLLGLAEAAQLDADICEVNGMLEVVAKCPRAVKEKMATKRAAGIVCEPLQGQVGASYVRELNLPAGVREIEVPAGVLGQVVEEVVNPPGRMTCSECSGVGVLPGPRTCPCCDGAGRCAAPTSVKKVPYEVPFEMAYRNCETCGGTGQELLPHARYMSICADCGGKGLRKRAAAPEDPEAAEHYQLGADE